MFGDVGRAIRYLHEDMNIIHRDIKLDNILYCPKNGRAKLTDFTVSQQLASETQRLLNSEGTPAFTAPECHVPDEEGGYLPKPTDIWSLGVCIFTFVSGRVPFYAESEIEM